MGKLKLLFMMSAEQVRAYFRLAVEQGEEKARPEVERPPAVPEEEGGDRA